MIKYFINYLRGFDLSLFLACQHLNSGIILILHTP
jgi:hypothetical protein